MLTTNLLPKSINKIVNNLKYISKINNETLVKLIEKSNLQEKDFFPYSMYKHPKSESYGRKILYKSAQFDIYLMSWNPYDFTAIHDHKHAEWGLIYFFSPMIHRVYSRSDNMLTLKKRENITKKTILPMQGELIHAMGNLSTENILSLHIYGTNKAVQSDESNIYDLINKKQYISRGPAFLNMNSAYYTAVNKEIETNHYTLYDYLQLTYNFTK